MLDIGLARWPLSACYPEKKWASARKETSISEYPQEGISGRKWRAMGEKMKKSEPVDISGIKITKLPPGKAFGADDLTKWSHNRAVGASGSGSPATKMVLLFCSKCEAETTIMVSKYQTKGRTRGLRCRNCGKSGGTRIRASRVDRI